MSRQNGAPVLLPRVGEAHILMQTHPRGADGFALEDDLQGLIHDHPQCLPIENVDPLFVGPVPICRELETPAGQIDNFMVTPSGLPVVIECKLWRNAEARREVVGQILDYAKELRRWSAADLQRAVRARLECDGDPVLDLVKAAAPSLDEISFNDALTANLRRSRMLLLIVGDGIREGVEAIAEYLQNSAGLRFAFGLIEMPVYAMPDGGRLVVPRVLARTLTVTRQVVAMPDGYDVLDPEEAAQERLADPELAAMGDERQAFWKEFLDGLKLDDPEQAIPPAPRMGFVGFMLPAPNGTVWLTVYRAKKENEVGVYLSANRGGVGDYVLRAVAEDWDNVRASLGGTVELDEDKYQRPRISDAFSTGPLDDPQNKVRAFDWLRQRVNDFVNVMRPRVRAAAADYKVSESTAST